MIYLENYDCFNKQDTLKEAKNYQIILANLEKQIILNTRTKPSEYFDIKLVKKNIFFTLLIITFLILLKLSNLLRIWI